ncbi:hypothetical protein F9K33_04170 [bacterium]|nr:MAG: hypothetical protein F9K33_04170 [bacterium]
MTTDLRKSSLVMLFSLMLFAFLSSCGENTGTTLTVDEEAIQADIEEDADEIYGLDIMNEDDPSSFSKSSSTSEAIDPFAYGRRLRNRQVERRALEFEVSETGQTAMVTITFMLRGQFVIRDRDTNTNTKGIYLKPFEHLMQRKATFQRNPDTLAVRKWLRTSVTPAYGISKNGTMSLTGDIHITVTHADQSVTNYTVSSDPLTTFFTGATVPTIVPGDMVKVEVAIANSNAADAPYGIIHRGRHAQPLSRLKQLFNDNGENGDATAADGVFTTQWTIQNNGIMGYHLGVLDFFTTTTIFDDTLPYNSLVVAFPYNKMQ